MVKQYTELFHPGNKAGLHLRDICLRAMDTKEVGGRQSRERIQKNIDNELHYHRSLFT